MRNDNESGTSAECIKNNTWDKLATTIRLLNTIEKGTMNNPTDACNNIMDQNRPYSGLFGMNNATKKYQNDRIDMFFLFNMWSIKLNLLDYQIKKW